MTESTLPNCRQLTLLGERVGEREREREFGMPPLTLPCYKSDVFGSSHKILCSWEARLKTSSENDLSK